MTAEQFAYNEYRDYITYRALAEVETVPDFKNILEELVKHEWDDFQFWLQFSPKKKFVMRRYEITLLKLMRRVLGLTFTAKFLELHERRAVHDYQEFLKTAPPEMKEKVADIIKHEEIHEKEMIGRIKEEQVAFTGSIVLGLNDGLIELTGALVGFSFALTNPKVVALTGAITGISAALSMASSAYMQARHEEGKDPRKSAIYTGVSYLVVVILLVVPFLFATNIYVALGIMLSTVFLVILGISYYTSVLFDRNFGSSLREMLMFSAGVAVIAFLIGTIFRVVSGIEI